MQQDQFKIVLGYMRPVLEEKKERKKETKRKKEQICSPTHSQSSF